MDAIEEVKSRLSIEDVIGEYVQLKRAGRNWRGLSPFTNEKSPSFMVSPEKQIWHDFSSGNGGNMFSFIMEVEGLDFKGALELLARKAGIDLEQYRTSSSPKGPDKNKLYEILEAAAHFYQAQFSRNESALSYVLKKRHFTKQTALTWRLGYSPNNGTALIDYLRTKGFSDAGMKQTGLSARAYKGGMQDMFRGRLMIPLQDPFGKVIGFTARLLIDDDRAPKYINTPQTVLYDKSRHIYGMHMAKEAIRKNNYAVIVEGNLDVIASHQAEVHQVVATAGTALTEPNLKTLRRFTSDIRVAFDADKAGLAATERAIPIANRADVSLSVIEIQEGKDPDELIAHDPKLWEKAIANNRYALDWLIDRYCKLLDIQSAEGKRQFSDILLPVVGKLSDEVEQDHYLQHISEIIGVSKLALDRKFNKVAAPEQKLHKRVKATPAQTDRETLESLKAQDNFLSLMLMRPTLREFMEITQADMFYRSEARSLFEFLKANPDFHGKLEDAKKVAAFQSPQETSAERELKSLPDYVKIESLLYEELYQGLELNELHYEAARLQARLIANYVKSKKESLIAQLDSADEPTIRGLLQQVKLYDQLLYKVKGASREEGKR